MLQYVVEEAAEAGIEQVIIVTSPGKESIASYFQPQPDLDSRLSDSPELLDKVRHASNLARVSFVIQEQPLGLGHAVLTAREAVGRPLVAVDAVGAGVGEEVFFVRGRAASFPFLPDVVPTDAAVTGICDHWTTDDVPAGPPRRSPRRRAPRR